MIKTPFEIPSTLENLDSNLSDKTEENIPEVF